MRIAPVEPPYDPATAEWLAKWMVPGVEADPLVLFRLLAVNQDLADRCRPMASGLLAKGRLPDRDRETVIGRTTARAGAEYEWGVHSTVFGPPDLYDALASDGPFEGRTAVLVRAADELYDTATISSPTWASLATLYDEQQLIELLLLAGWYRTLSTVINAVEIPLEPWAARFPSQAENASSSTSSASDSRASEDASGGRNRSTLP